MEVTPKEKTASQLFEELEGEKNKRSKVEADLQKSQEQLHQAQKMETLGTLVAGIAHEINNPINLIMYNTPLLKKVWYDFQPVLLDYADKQPDRKYGGLSFEFLKENLEQLISDVDMAANRVAKIITDLKDFARKSSVADKRPIQINQAVKNAMRLVKSTLKKAGVEIQLDLTPVIPLMEGNLQNIEQIILNITINAIQAIHHGDGVVKVSTGFQNQEGRLFVSISDNGDGVNPDISNRLFDPFVTDKQAEGGTGLGLSVSYGLIRAHDGKVTFKSSKGNGSTFTVSFPMIKTEKVDKILIVDDDQAIRQLLLKSLKTVGPYRLEVAVNGIEACIKLGSFRPHLLILDIFMPDMDGLEVCRALKKDPNLAKVNVIITTGFPDHPKLKQVTDLGFTNIHAKPFNLSQFAHTVSNILTKE
jgi:signal transduction histidine kinase